MKKFKTVLAFILAFTFIFSTAAPVSAFKRVTRTVERENMEISYWEGDFTYTRDGRNVTLVNTGGRKILPNTVVFRGASSTRVHRLTTGEDSFATFYLCNENRLGVMTNKLFLRMEENTEIEVTINTRNNRASVKVIKGTLSEETDVKSTSNMRELMTFISSIDKEKVQEQVEGWRGRRTNEQLANHVITNKSRRAGFLGAVVGLGGAFTIPAEMGAIAAQWLIQAELAYALACVYGDPPSHEDFINDLYVLFAGEEIVREALREIRQPDILGAAEALGQRWVRSKAFKDNSSRLVRSLQTRLTRMVATSGAKFAGRAIPLVGAVIGGATNEREARAFGERAKKFYTN